MQEEHISQKKFLTLLEITKNLRRYPQNLTISKLKQIILLSNQIFSSTNQDLTLGIFTIFVLINMISPLNQLFNRSLLNKDNKNQMPYINLLERQKYIDFFGGQSKRFQQYLKILKLINNALIIYNRDSKEFHKIQTQLYIYLEPIKELQNLKPIKKYSLFPEEFESQYFIRLNNVPVNIFFNEPQIGIAVLYQKDQQFCYKVQKNKYVLCQLFYMVQNEFLLNRKDKQNLSGLLSTINQVMTIIISPILWKQYERKYYINQISNKSTIKMVEQLKQIYQDLKLSMIKTNDNATREKQIIYNKLKNIQQNQAQNNAQIIELVNEVNDKIKNTIDQNSNKIKGHSSQLQKINKQSILIRNQLKKIQQNKNAFSERIYDDIKLLKEQIKKDQYQMNQRFSLMLRQFNLQLTSIINKNSLSQANNVKILQQKLKKDIQQLQNKLQKEWKYKFQSIQQKFNESIKKTNLVHNQLLFLTSTINKQNQKISQVQTLISSNYSQVNSKLNENKRSMQNYINSKLQQTQKMYDQDKRSTKQKFSELNNKMQQYTNNKIEKLNKLIQQRDQINQFRNKNKFDSYAEKNKGLAQQIISVKNKIKQNKHDLSEQIQNNVNYLKILHSKSTQQTKQYINQRYNNLQKTNEQQQQKINLLQQQNSKQFQKLRQQQFFINRDVIETNNKLKRFNQENTIKLNRQSNRLGRLILQNDEKRKRNYFQTKNKIRQVDEIIKIQTQKLQNLQQNFNDYIMIQQIQADPALRYLAISDIKISELYGSAKQRMGIVQYRDLKPKQSFIQQQYY